MPKLGLALLTSAVVGATAVQPAVHPVLSRSPLVKSLIADSEKLIAERVEEGVTLNRSVRVFTLFDARFRRIAKVWRDCIMKAIPRPLSAMSVEAKELSKKGLSLLQLGRSRLPTTAFSHMLVTEWAGKLKHSDTLHVDADAFLLRDPVRGTVVKYPEADVIAEVDCVYDKPQCSWYRRQEYLDRNKGQDPLQDRGFMLNTGFMYLRSQPATLQLLNRTSDLTRDGENDQVAFNEVLLTMGCNWTTSDGSPVPTGPAAQEFLAENSVFGSCQSGMGADESQLRVVVLPRSVVQRQGPVGREALAYHPGGRIEDKERILSLVRRMCLSKRV